MISTLEVMVLQVGSGTRFPSSNYPNNHVTAHCSVHAQFRVSVPVKYVLVTHSLALFVFLRIAEIIIRESNLSERVIW